MRHDTDVKNAQCILPVSMKLAASESLQSRRAGERINSIIKDLLYELDPWKYSVPDYHKPLPVVTEENKEHWAAAQRHEFRLQKCDACETVRNPIAPVCYKCLSTRWHWAKMSGVGTLSSWVVFHKAYWAEYEKDVPYIVAQVELEEGPRYTSGLIDIRQDDLKIGMPLTVSFEKVTADITLPMFRPG